MHLGHSIDTGNKHLIVAAPHEGRVHVYGSLHGQPHAGGAHLTAKQARELAAALLVIADDLDPPRAVTGSIASRIGNPTSNGVATFTKPGPQ
jgi:hypothetical protein